jgi:aspartate/methionine/tyrosine aminotransferase
MLIPNPFYAVYAAGAVAADCEPVYLDATAANGFLPDLDALAPDLLARTAAFYLASPANPQGSIADAAYLQRLIALARRHGFMVFADECYSEIYWKDAPPGTLEQAGSDFANVAVFHSLSKRSSLPGLRMGFVAGDKTFHQAVPRPALGRSAAGAGSGAGGRDRGLWRRGACGGKPRALSRQVRSRRPDHRQSLRLQAPARRLLPLARRVATWRQRRRDGEALERGRLARAAGQLRGPPQADGSNPGDGYIRIAMVQDRDVTADALYRLVAVLG